MKPVVISFIIVIVSLGAFLYLVNQNTEESVVSHETISQSLSVTDFEQLITTGEHIVIDVRTPKEYKEGTITKNPLTVDFYTTDFTQQLSQLDKDQPYLIYCHSGNRSSKTLKIMQSLGFTNVSELAGGKTTWEKSGRSLTKT